jgi:hypothetical protein
MADEDLPPSYVKRCERFLKKFNKRFKPQAPSATIQTQLQHIYQNQKENDS